MLHINYLLQSLGAKNVTLPAVHVSTVTKNVKKMKSKKAPDVYEVVAEQIKKAAKPVNKSLTYLVNQLLGRRLEMFHHKGHF